MPAMRSSSTVLVMAVMSVVVTGRPAPADAPPGALALRIEAF